MDVNSVLAFAKAQSEMGVALKKSNNPYFKSKYADLNEVQNAVFPAFHANGFAIYWEGGADQYGQYQECVLHHSSGDKFKSRCYLLAKKDDMQAIGGAITYARRYTLCSITGVPVEDDDGNYASGRNKEEHQPKPTDGLQKAVQAGMKLQFALGTATPEKMIDWEDRAQSVIEDLEFHDPDFAARLKESWNSKKEELGV